MEDDGGDELLGIDMGTLDQFAAMERYASGASASVGRPSVSAELRQREQ